MHDERLTQGVEFFNKGYFFECHDILEDLWMDTTGSDKLFLQGLIQIAVGYYHFFNENYKGAVSQLTKGLTKLGHYRPAHLNIEVERLVNEVRLCLHEAELGREGKEVRYTESQVPKMNFIN